MLFYHSSKKKSQLVCSWWWWRALSDISVLNWVTVKAVSYACFQWWLFDLPQSWPPVTVKTFFATNFKKHSFIDPLPRIDEIGSNMALNWYWFSLPHHTEPFTYSIFFPQYMYTLHYHTLNLPPVPLFAQFAVAYNHPYIVWIIACTALFLNLKTWIFLLLNLHYSYKPRHSGCIIITCASWLV